MKDGMGKGKEEEKEYTFLGGHVGRGLGGGKAGRGWAGDHAHACTCWTSPHLDPNNIQIVILN